MGGSDRDDSDDYAEIEAMRTVAGVLRTLDPVSRERVLRWTLERFATPGASHASPGAMPSPTPAPDGTGKVVPYGGGDLADLYAACSPETDAEKTLVVAYWIQEEEGAAGIDAQSVNTRLKHLGHGVGNITRAFDRLIDNRPQLMIQTKKAGTTKQARKTYRVTLEGKKAIQELRGYRQSLSAAAHF